MKFSCQKILFRKLTFGFTILIPSTVGFIGESTHFRSISKLTNFYDYAINDVTLQGIDVLWGPHTVDRFVCSYNAKLPRFNSRFFSNPVVKLSTSFLKTGVYDNNWLCPPVYLIARVLKHMEVCCAEGTLVLHLLKSPFFWNVCTRDGEHWNSLVIDWVYLPKFQGLFVKGKARNSLFGTRSLEELMLLPFGSIFVVPGLLPVLSGFCTLPCGTCSFCS